MSDETHDIWALRIHDAIRSAEDTERPPAGRRKPKALLLAFAAEAAAVAGAVSRNVDGVDILGADRHDTIEGFLDRMLAFEEFVFLEYRYKTPSKEEPGLRFTVVQKETETRILVHYFRDLVFWDVDEAGRRVFLQPIRFFLKEGRIRADPLPDLAELYAGCLTWRLALRETIALPFRHLYEKGFSLTISEPDRPDQ